MIVAYRIYHDLRLRTAAIMYEYNNIHNINRDKLLEFLIDHLPILVYILFNYTSVSPTRRLYVDFTYHSALLIMFSKSNLKSFLNILTRIAPDSSLSVLVFFWHSCLQTTSIWVNEMQNISSVLIIPRLYNIKKFQLCELWAGLTCVIMIQP